MAIAWKIARWLSSLISRGKILAFFALIALFSCGASASVYSVSIDDMPSRYPEKNPVDISGSAQGSSLDSLTALYRRVGTTEWVELETVDCGDSSSCSLNTNFSSSRTGHTDFVLVGRSGQTVEISEKETVVFTAVPPEDLIDSVDLDAPDQAETSTATTLNASATGENLETLKIQRKIGTSWADLESIDCQRENTCEAETEYSSENSGDQQFRARIIAGEQSQNSRKETISFTEPYQPPEITDVDIDDLPDTHPVSRSLEIGGNAEGTGLQRIEVQRKNQSSSNWLVIRGKNCSEESYCEISASYSSGTNSTQNFRISTFTSNSSLSSSTRTVEFTEIVNQGSRGSSIDSVSVDDLPRYIETGGDVDISAEASGNKIDRLQLLKRYENRNTDWIKIKQKDCSDSENCRITEEDFTNNRAESVSFVAKASAGGKEELSDIETVEFFGSSGSRGGRDRDSDDARLRVHVEDENGEDLEDALVEVENGESRSRYTGEEGEAYFWLESGGYEVRVSKEMYEDETRDIDLDENEYRRLDFELDRDKDYESDNIVLTSLEYDRQICQGENLRVDFDLSNRENSDTTLAVWGTGLGGADSKVVELESEDIVEESLVFRDIQGSGTREFTIYARNSETVTATGTVDVENCGRIENRQNEPSGLTVDLSPNEAFRGETVRVSGEILGADTSYPVTVRSGSETIQISSDRDGGYQAFLSPETIGDQVIRVSAAGFTERKNLEVLPRAKVAKVDAPRKVFSGEPFEICGSVESDVEAEVLLLRDDKIINSRKDSGEICFELTDKETGSYIYTVRALTYGESSEAVKRVKVLESGDEFQTFPEKLITVEKEPGMARVSLFNKDIETRSFQISIEDVDSSWVSSTSKNVVVPGGGREKVYFYFSPRKAGSFNPEINVFSSGEKLYEKSITLESKNAEQPRPDYFLAALNQRIFG